MAPFAVTLSVDAFSERPRRESSEEVKKKVSRGRVNRPPPSPKTTKPTTKVASAPRQVTHRAAHISSANAAATGSARTQGGFISNSTNLSPLTTMKVTFGIYRDRRVGRS